MNEQMSEEQQRKSDAVLEKIQHARETGSFHGIAHDLLEELLVARYGKLAPESGDMTEEEIQEAIQKHKERLKQNCRQNDSNNNSETK